VLRTPLYRIWGKLSQVKDDKQRKGISDFLQKREREVRKERKFWIILKKSIPLQYSLSTDRIMFGVDFFLEIFYSPILEKGVYYICK